MSIKLCIGLLTHCNDVENPERFEILKKSVDSLERLVSPEVYIYVWDNCSTPGVREYLQSKNIFNEMHFSDENLYDVVAVHKLVQVSEKLGAPYVCHLEDDFLFYDHKFVDACCEFLDTNKDCGYLRILKYEFDRKHVYDKFMQHPLLDAANCQRHFNQITKESLEWESAGNILDFQFYKNNWHWYNYANICRREVFKSIIPHEDHEPLQRLEGYMMQKYEDLGLKVGVLDLGVVSHIGQFTEKTSQRIKLISQKKQLPTISYKGVLREIEKHELPAD